MSDLPMIQRRGVRPVKCLHGGSALATHATACPLSGHAIPSTLAHRGCTHRQCLRERSRPLPRSPHHRHQRRRTRAVGTPLNPAERRGRHAALLTSATWGARPVPAPLAASVPPPFGRTPLSLCLAVSAPAASVHENHTRTTWDCRRAVAPPAVPRQYTPFLARPYSVRSRPCRCCRAAAACAAVCRRSSSNYGKIQTLRQHPQNHTLLFTSAAPAVRLQAEFHVTSKSSSSSRN